MILFLPEFRDSFFVPSLKIKTEVLFLKLLIELDRKVQNRVIPKTESFEFVRGEKKVSRIRILKKLEFFHQKFLILKFPKKSEIFELIPNYMNEILILTNFFSLLDAVRFFPQFFVPSRKFFF